MLYSQTLDEACHNVDSKKPSAEAALATLERQVSALTTLCERLISANQVLVKRCDQMQEQQRDWRRKNRQASSVVEQVLSQLRPYARIE